jgi:hypothetical protein
VKTISLKKVSAVAVASLGFGLLSVVPAQAVAQNCSGWTVFRANATSINLKAATTTPVTGAAVYVNMGAVTSTAVPASTTASQCAVTQYRAVLTSYPAGGFVTAAGSTNVQGATAGTRATVTNSTTVSAATSITGAVAGNSLFQIATTSDDTSAGAISYGGDTITATATSAMSSFAFTPTVAGTYVLTVWNDGPAIGATTIGNGAIDPSEAQQTISITVAAAPGLSAGTSSAFIIAGNGTDAPSSTTDALPIEVLSKNSSNAAYSSVTLSATLTGPGYLDWRSGDADPVAGRCSATPTYSATISRAISAQTADDEGQLYVCAAGDAGTATVTVTLTDTVSGISAQIGSTKTITFYGSVAKLELVKSVWTNIRAGGYWQDGADADTAAELRALTAAKTQSVTIKMTDSAGRVANASAEPTVVSGDTAVIAQGLCGLDDNADTTYSSGGTGYYNCGFQSATSAKSGDKATVTIRIVDPADATKFLTVTANLTIGGSVASEVITTDKTTYTPGENMVVTITAKDSAGNPAYDGAATPSAIVASKSAIGLPSAASFYQGGKKSWGSTGGVYAPALGGTFTLTATGTDAAAKTLTATASVTDANAGLLTQIDALNAKIVALNALIAKIMKKLGVK